MSQLGLATINQCTLAPCSTNCCTSLLIPDQVCHHDWFLSFQWQVVTTLQGCSCTPSVGIPCEFDLQLATSPCVVPACASLWANGPLSLACQTDIAQHCAQGVDAFACAWFTAALVKCPPASTAGSWYACAVSLNDFVPNTALQNYTLLSTQSSTWLTWSGWNWLQNYALSGNLLKWSATPICALSQHWPPMGVRMMLCAMTRLQAPAFTFTPLNLAGLILLLLYLLQVSLVDFFTPQSRRPPPPPPPRYSPPGSPSQP